jgi:nucleoside 2-deoxyribosyltransferase
MEPNPTLYIAAAIFNGREAIFNTSLADKLGCDIGCDTILPQRDGFEFTSLAESLSKQLPPKDVMLAVQNIIYSLDIGYFIPRSDMIIANLDEPIDEGVIVEICYGRSMGKKIIGFRTDTRSPYGALTDSFRGIHTFPAYQCDIFVSHYMQIRNGRQNDGGMEALAQKLRTAMIELKPGITEGLPEQALSDPNISRVLSNAKILFEGIDIFSIPSSVSEITVRYLQNRAELEKLIPKVMV